MENQTRKAVALMSGGLDSTLAAKLVKDQGIDVWGLHLLSPFACREEVEKSAQSIGIPLLVREKGEKYLDLIKNPKYGYGKNMNPCIDCRIFMFQMAQAVMEEIGADFLITGEVLGQRPMSQRRDSISIIDRNSQLKGKVLRPLSAHCLPPTIAETEGWVDRNLFFNISGRGRRPQLDLADSMGVTEFSNPAGGCLLTQPSFKSKVADYFSHEYEQQSNVRMVHTELLSQGRHFRLSETLRVIVARNQEENERLASLWPTSEGTLFIPESFDGPNALVLGEPKEEERVVVGEMIVRYGKSQIGGANQITYESSQSKGSFVISQPISEERLGALRI